MHGCTIRSCESLAIAGFGRGRGRPKKNLDMTLDRTWRLGRRVVGSGVLSRFYVGEARAGLLCSSSPYLVALNSIRVVSCFAIFITACCFLCFVHLAILLFVIFFSILL